MAAPLRSGVLVKAPKAGQELRVDMPTIGPDTITGAAAAGLSGIAVATGHVLVLDAPEVERRARDLGIALHVTPFDTVPVDCKAPPHHHLRQLSRNAPSRADLADAQTGIDTVMRLAAFQTGGATAVIRGHVLAIAATESPDALGARVATLRQWGSKRLTSPRGALTVRIDGADAAVALQALIPHLKMARIAGLAVAGLDQDHASWALPLALIAEADAAGVFVVEAHPPLFARSVVS
jgi:DUF1009 family protein